MSDCYNTDMDWANLLCVSLDVNSQGKVFAGDQIAEFRTQQDAIKTITAPGWEVKPWQPGDFRGTTTLINPYYQENLRKHLETDRIQRHKEIAEIEWAKYSTVTVACSGHVMANGRTLARYDNKEQAETALKILGFLRWTPRSPIEDIKYTK